MYVLHSNFSSIFTHFRDIAATVFPPYSSLPKIPRVPPGVSGWLLGYEYVWLITTPARDSGSARYCNQFVHNVHNVAY